MNYQKSHFFIKEHKNLIEINAGILRKTLLLTNDNLSHQNLILFDQRDNKKYNIIKIAKGNGNKKNLIQNTDNSELIFDVYYADPNKCPTGLKEENASEIIQENKDIGKTDGLNIKSSENIAHKEDIKWIKLSSIKSFNWNTLFELKNITIEHNHLIISFRIKDSPSTDSDKKILDKLKDLEVDLCYNIYTSYPAIRKNVIIKNSGKNWIKIDNLILENITVDAYFNNKTHFTPSERGADSSIIAYSNKDCSKGIIEASEIPSALRRMGAEGQMGYNYKEFEWILGPNEEFTSEYVNVYGFLGKTFKTMSAMSSELDRVIEEPFQQYLTEILKIKADPTKLTVPRYCTWSHFHAEINEKIIEEIAPIAASAGFKCFQLDAGWSDSENPADWTCSSIIPHKIKFPDFDKTSKLIQSLNMQLGLWYSCFRNKDSPDLKEHPDYKSVPIVRRGEGYGMSFTSGWKDYYYKDIIFLAKQYNCAYFKQDLTNIKFGDFAENHDSRSLRESKLKGLRGFFYTQDKINEQLPDVNLLLSHELYWGTPGTPCDIAALQHSWAFHIPPNDYSGCGIRTKRVKKKKQRFLSIYKRGLLNGCKHARNRLYAHRGLPLYCIEYYGAATANIDGTLNEKIQDRQICSWLMGAPTVYAGDLASLTPKNINHYKKRFKLIERLQSDYNIYKYFQFSGVPKPTDLNWHWWGKLNGQKSGIVVVLRGQFGNRSRNINIPWVNSKEIYEVKLLFQNKPLGKYKGEELQKGVIKLQLPRYGQEIIEIKKIQ